MPTDEFEAYGQQIAALGKQSAQLNVQALQQAYQQGNVSMQPNGARFYRHRAWAIAIDVRRALLDSSAGPGLIIYRENNSVTGIC